MRETLEQPILFLSWLSGVNDKRISKQAGVSGGIMIDIKKLGNLVKDGHLKEWSCGCLLVDSKLQPIILPCVWEHFELLKKERGCITMPFGKHKGEPLDQLPIEYLMWLDEQELDEPLKSKVHEIVSRGDFA